MRNTIKKVNYVYLITAVIYLLGGMEITRFVKDAAWQLVCLQLSLALPTILYWIVERKNPAEQLELHLLRFGDVVLVLLFTVLVMPTLTLLNALTMLFSSYNVSDSMFEMSAQISFPVMFLITAVVPAIFEEMVYRGMFFHEYRKVSLFHGALLSAVMFGMMHGNINQFAYAFVLGFFMAMVIAATGSIVSSMLMHLTMNGCSVVLMYVIAKLENSNAAIAGAVEEAETLEMTLPFVLKSYLVPAVLGLFLAFQVYRVLARRNGKTVMLRNAFGHDRKAHSFREFITPALVATFCILAFLMLMVEIVY